jgi:hypothetical protein
MRRLFRRDRVANDQPKHVHWDVFLAFCNLLGHIDKPWAILTQRKWLERIKGTTGRTMSVRTLQRHLLWLEKNLVIARTQRHLRTRRGFTPRPSLYTFGIAAPLWINRLRDAGRVPFGRLRVPKMALSRKPSLSACPLCGQIAHRTVNRAPRKRGEVGPPKGRHRSNGAGGTRQ